jgi:hypothetical protein
MADVEIQSAVFTDAGWAVRANVKDGPNSWSGPLVLDLPEAATPAEIEAAVLALYGLAP